MFLHKNLGFFSQLPILYFQKVTVIPTIIYENDPYLNYVVLNINGDTALSGNNNIFLDSGSGNISLITPTNPNNLTQGSFSPFSPTGWSAYFSTTSDRISTFSNNIVGDFTIELWIYRTSPIASLGDTTLFRFLPTTLAGGGIHIWIKGVSNLLVIDDGVTGTTPLPNVSIPLYSWCHIAVVRNGTTTSGYINGVLAGTLGITGAGNSFTPSTNFYVVIGGQFGFYGYMSNVRILKNSALYTAPFTPNRTESLKLLPNTSLLTFQNNTFIDNSTNNLNLSGNGLNTPRMVPFSPITSSINYDPTLHGSSGYFNSGFLDIPSNSLFAFPNGTDFTIESWINCSSFDNNRFLSINNGIILYIPNGTPTFGIYNGATLLTSNTNLLVNTWYHIAVTRSGTVLRMFINGVQTAINNNDTSSYAQNPFRIGGDFGGLPFVGYISNLRIIKDKAVYTSNFKLPSIPVTSTSNGNASIETTVIPDLLVRPSLLLNFDKGGIIDRSYNSNVLVFGNTQTQTTISRSGAGSLVFDGDGDYLNIPTNTNLGLSGSDFTIEFWINRVGAGTNQQIIDFGTGARPAIYINNLNRIVYFTISDRLTANLTQNTWNHVAVVRRSNVTRMFVNGISGTQTQFFNDTSLYLTPSPTLSIGANTSNTNFLNGYLEDFRITKGIARYTTNNFTPPNKLQANTSDTDFKNVVLFLDGNTIDSNINNSSFLANAGQAAGLTITTTGSARQGSFSPYSPNGWSGYFNGSTFLNTTSTNSNLNFNGVDWTIEAYVYASSANDAAIIQSTTGTNNWLAYLSIRILSNLTISCDINAVQYVTTQTIELNQWTHLALVRNNGIVKLYINGEASSISQTSDIFNSNLSFYIGKLDNTSGLISYYNGYISNLRVIKGLAVYTSPFTPPTEKLPALSGSQFSTSLLTLQDNRFKDNSTNNFELSVGAGTPNVQSFNPFKKTIDYSPIIHGGSGYFDGSSYLSITTNLTQFYISTGSTTVECYVYKTSTTKDVIISQSQNNQSPYNGWSFYINNQTLTLETSSTQTVSSNIPVPLNQWVHVAFVRVNTSVTLYINGIIAGSGTLSITDHNGNLTIGSYSNAASNYFNGYISNLRFVKGRSIYTSNFTPPTSPVTNVNGTALLLNFDNAYVIDSTNNNVITTVSSSRTDVLNNAPLSSSNGSLYFDGTSHISILSSFNYNFDTNVKFTIECWINRIGDGSDGSGTGEYDAIVSHADADSTSGTWGLYVKRSDNVIGFYNGNTFKNTTTSITNGVWTHIAVVRNSTNLITFINGVSSYNSENADATNSLNRNLIIGWDNSTGTNKNYKFKGYIDDLRITKGVARYTSNFIPKTYKNPTFNILTYPTDSYRNFVVLDLNAETFNNEQNNTFLDKSGNNLTITRTGSTTQGSFSPFSPAGWSVYFNNNSYIDIPSNTSFGFLSGTDFTIESWINCSSFVNNRFYSTNTGGAILYFPNGTPRFGAYSVVDNLISNTNLLVDTWYHIAVTRSGTVSRMFINGVQTAINNNDTTNYATNALRIGGDFAANRMHGYASNLRVVKGQALYTSNFTPLTSDLTTTSTVSSNPLIAGNVSLLTLKDSNLKDNSNNNLTSTLVGPPNVIPYSPFQQKNRYSPTVHGGGGYFNGGSYLTIPQNNLFNFGTDDFTIECWVNTSNFSQDTSYRRVLGFGADAASNIQLIFFNGTAANIKLSVYTNTTIINGTIDVANGIWHHISLSRNFGNLRLFVDGIQSGSTVSNNTTDFNAGSSNSLSIGKYGGTTDGRFDGYISNLRIVKGVGIIPPFGGPTAPVQAVSGTSLLLNFDNAGVVDSTGKNNVTTFNNAKVDYANKKYGSGSLKFNGTNDYLQVGTASDWTFLHSPSAKWTIEFWVYNNSVGSDNIILDTSNFASAATGISIWKTSNERLQVGIHYGTGGSYVLSGISTNTIPLATWTHVAITYNHVDTSNNMVMYFNGISSDVFSKTANNPATNNPSNTLSIGCRGNGIGNFFNGSIDELRITNAVRYTGDFTVSTYVSQLSS